MRAPSVFLFLLLFLSCAIGYGQSDTPPRAETTRTGLPQAPETTRTTTPRRIQIQAADTLVRQRASMADSLATPMAPAVSDSVHTDSLQQHPVVQAAETTDTSTYRAYYTHPGLAMDRPPVYRLTEYRKRSSRDELFYLMTGVLFFLAFVKAGFPRYFRNLFVLFFQTNLRQKQTRDQLLQDNFASLLMNVLFFISGGLYITLLSQRLGWTEYPFWIVAGASAAVLLAIYLGKYLFLLFSGWVFNTRDAAGSYVFMVFMVNKVMGILLIPFLLLLAFADSAVTKHAITVSIGLVALLFIYRYFVSFTAVRSRLRVNVFHFLLYLCSVEILPLLLIYKLLLNYFNGTL